VREVRGRGLMIGVDVDRDAWPMLEAAIARAGDGDCGLLILSGGPRTLRFLPPYTIGDDEIVRGLGIVRELLGD